MTIGPSSPRPGTRGGPVGATGCLRPRRAGALVDEFVRLAADPADATTVHGVLDRVVQVGRAVIPGADLVSGTLRTATGFTTPAMTDKPAERLDELQYRLDDGPCVEATRTPGLGVALCGDLGAPWEVRGARRGRRPAAPRSAPSADEPAYRADDDDADAEHNRIRREMFAPISEIIERVRFTLGVTGPAQYS